MMNHELYIQRTLMLANKGSGEVSPNPRVGAVLVKNNQIIAEGYHHFFGGPHAEIITLQNLSHQETHNATIYVNIEPCSHYGKTPPCTKAIIDIGIRKVVYGMKDPNPLVSGRGIQELKNAGIEVIGPVLEDLCLQLNAGFVKSIVKEIPYITLKIAQTLDGRIALENGRSRWITNKLSKKQVHQLRSEHDAVLVGIQTVIQDNPRLDVRLTDGPSPKRLVLDANLRIPVQSNIIQQDPEKTWVITSKNTDKKKKTMLQDAGITIIEAPVLHGLIQLDTIWKQLIQGGICSILIEGGQKVFTHFLESRWVDQLYIFIAPKLFGHGISSINGLKINTPQPFEFKSVTWQMFGTDILFKGKCTCLRELLKKSAL